MGYTLTWQNGRQLALLSGNGTTASYTYDVDGLRTSKTVNGVKHEYYYVGSRLQYEKYGTTELWFFYDADGTPSGIRYKNGDSINDYYFVCNWRGDVTEIYDSTGALAASYSYDAWGKVVSVKDASGAAITSSTHIANVNPIRYRGYYYDTETSLYYLKSRYYDPQVKRFLNADGYVQTGDGLYDKNMFAYCLNNPVNSSDPTGQFPWIVLGVIVLCGVVGGIIGYNSKSKLIDKPKTTQNSSNYKKQSNSNNNNTSKTKSNTSKGKSNASKGKSSSSNRNVSRHQNRGSISHNTENNRLSSSDRAMNTFIGATLGIAVGGAAVALVGVGIAVIGGAVALGAQVAAIGCLAFNAEAIIFAPFYGIEMEPIDWDYGY